jgi:hypothetical protein
MTEFYEPDRGGRRSGSRAEEDKQRQELEKYIKDEELSPEEAKYYRELFDAPFPRNRAKATDGRTGESDHGSHGARRGGDKETSKGGNW